MDIAAGIRYVDGPADTLYIYIWDEQYQDYVEKPLAKGSEIITTIPDEVDQCSEIKFHGYIYFHPYGIYQMEAVTGYVENDIFYEEDSSGAVTVNVEWPINCICPYGETPDRICGDEKYGNCGFEDPNERFLMGHQYLCTGFYWEDQGPMPDCNIIGEVELTDCQIQDNAEVELGYPIQVSGKIITAEMPSAIVGFEYYEGPSSTISITWNGTTYTLSKKDTLTSEIINAQVGDVLSMDATINYPYPGDYDIRCITGYEKEGMFYHQYYCPHMVHVTGGAPPDCSNPPGYEGDTTCGVEEHGQDPTHMYECAGGSWVDLGEDPECAGGTEDMEIESCSIIENVNTNMPSPASATAHVLNGPITDAGVGLAYIDGPSNSVFMVINGTTVEVFKNGIARIYLSGDSPTCTSIPISGTIEYPMDGTYTMWCAAGQMIGTYFDVIAYEEHMVIATAGAPPDCTNPDGYIGDQTCGNSAYGQDPMHLYQCTGEGWVDLGPDPSCQSQSEMALTGCSIENTAYANTPSPASAQAHVDIGPVTMAAVGLAYIDGPSASISITLKGTTFQVTKNGAALTGPPGDSPTCTNLDTELCTILYPEPGNYTVQCVAGRIVGSMFEVLDSEQHIVTVESNGGDGEVEITSCNILGTAQVATDSAFSMVGHVITNTVQNACAGIGYQSGPSSTITVKADGSEWQISKGQALVRTYASADPCTNIELDGMISYPQNGTYTINCIGGFWLDQSTIQVQNQESHTVIVSGQAPTCSNPYGNEGDQICGNSTYGQDPTHLYQCTGGTWDDLGYHPTCKDQAGINWTLILLAGGAIVGIGIIAMLATRKKTPSYYPYPYYPPAR